MTFIPIIKYFIASKSSEDGRDGSVRVRASLSWQKIIYRREHAAAATAFTERPTWVLHSTPTRQPSPNSIPPYHAHAINTFKTIKNLVLKHTFDLLTTIACYVHSPLLPYQRSPLLEITPTSTGVFPTPENGHYANSPHTLHADSYSNLPYLLFYIQCKASSCIPIIIINAITFNPVLVLTQTHNHVPCQWAIYFLRPSWINTTPATVRQSFALEWAQHITCSTHLHLSCPAMCIYSIW